MRPVMRSTQYSLPLARSRWSGLWRNKVRYMPRAGARLQQAKPVGGKEMPPLRAWLRRGGERLSLRGKQLSLSNSYHCDHGGTVRCREAPRDLHTKLPETASASSGANSTSCAVTRTISAPFLRHGSFGSGHISHLAGRHMHCEEELQGAMPLGSALCVGGIGGGGQTQSSLVSDLLCHWQKRVVEHLKLFQKEFLSAY
jgi:hypothetical protein